MSKYLVKTVYNYDDERNIQSFCVVTEKKYDKIQKKIDDFLDRGEEPITVHLGDGGSLRFHNSDAVYSVRNMEITIIDDDTYDMFKKIFTKSYGECSLRTIYGALKDQLFIEETCDCGGDDE